MTRARTALIMVILLFFGALAFMTWATDEQYLPIALFLVCAAIVPFFLHFERRSLQSREIVLVAVLSAIAAVGRVPFAVLPSVQPTSFVIIVTGLVFGAETGFMVGALAALVSNMFLGQGPWTPWQMFGWGMIGCTAGVMNQWGWLKNRFILLVFGFLWGILFGWIMNIWFLANIGQDVTWPVVLTAYASSFYFDLAHALSNVIFLSVMGSGWIKILKRYKRKYGLLEITK
ncbi:ECF transporter S component [Paenibacillus frigoriresistens]|uniref:ECF transporter S component n=1 Tax=Paenibacillus alginolyticus TaxID=59839 RepID=UPI00156594F2|nr:ECF transporter S component [Paenibacillus frigoriresistens]NRF96241.1 ECF transporter S component [Paenibacillus frigoriresistens]